MQVAKRRLFVNFCRGMSYSYQRETSPSSSKSFHNQPRQQFYTRTYYSLDEEPQCELRPSTSVTKCSVGTCTSGGYLGADSYQRTSPHHQDVSLSPQRSTSAYTTQQRYSPRLAPTSDDDSHYHNSPLSDSLLLALRRSRPNTR